MAPNLLEGSAQIHNLTRGGGRTPSTPRSQEAQVPVFQGATGSTAGSSTAWLSAPASFHIQTRLVDGRPSIIVDPGSVGNLCGDKWAREVALAAHRTGHKPSYEKRSSPLKVSGVGNGSQDCPYDCTFPVVLKPTEGSQATIGTLTAPVMNSSELPGLLGLNALKKNRAVLDFTTLRLHFAGPGDVDMLKALPPGSDSYQLELAPIGAYCSAL